MFTKASKQEAANQFKAKHPDLVAQAEAKGLDWQALLAKFGPLIVQILQLLLGGK